MAEDQLKHPREIRLLSARHVAPLTQSNVVQSPPLLMNVRKLAVSRRPSPLPPGRPACQIIPGTPKR
jgi:hypothetical protein